jgi:hypothetical protein
VISPPSFPAPEKEVRYLRTAAPACYSPEGVAWCLGELLAVGCVACCSNNQLLAEYTAGTAAVRPRDPLLEQVAVIVMGLLWEALKKGV